MTHSDPPRDADAECPAGGPPAGPEGRGDPDRRRFLSSVSGVAMAGGLAAGYGTFAALAGRYLHATGTATAWMYVVPVAEIEPGASLAYDSPAGLKIVITRRSGGSQDAAPSASDFLALSSICPHLGCRVHWEPHHNRFFCPCHNGVFDPAGQPVEGPPKADHQPLPTYPLRVDNGLLFIETPVEVVGQDQSAHAPGSTAGMGEPGRHRNKA